MTMGKWWGIRDGEKITSGLRFIFSFLSDMSPTFGNQGDIKNTKQCQDVKGCHVALGHWDFLFWVMKGCWENVWRWQGWWLVLEDVEKHYRDTKGCQIMLRRCEGCWRTLKIIIIIEW
jgi:hypothetical protein